MTAFKGLGTYGDSAGVVTPLDHKLAQAGQVARASATEIRPGLFWGGTGTIVSGKANMSYDVAAYRCVTTRGASAGAVFGGNDGTLNLTTDVDGNPIAAPGSNSRYHVVFHWHREFSLDGVDSNPVIGVVQGTAAASPTVPSLAAYPGAIELARILVPAGVTATNSGTTITQMAPFTAMAGGVIPFRNTTERDAGTYLEGQLGWLVDSDTMQRYGTSWATLGTPALIPVIPTSVAGSGVTLGAGGKVSFSSASTVSINGCFTSAFENYRIVIRTTFGSAAFWALKMRVGGTDASTAYDWQRHTAVSTTSAAATGANETAWNGLAISALALGRIEIELDSPAVATATFASALMTETNGSGSIARVSWGGYHRTATAYDGISFIASTSSGTGSIRIYGYNDN